MIIVDADLIVEVKDYSLKIILPICLPTFKETIWLIENKLFYILDQK